MRRLRKRREGCARLRTAEVVPPQGPDLVLTANVPDIKFDVFVGDSLDVEADGGDCGDVLAKLQLVEDGGLAGSIESQHEQSHLLGSEDLTHHLGELATHRGGLWFLRRTERVGCVDRACGWREGVCSLGGERTGVLG